MAGNKGYRYSYHESHEEPLPDDVDASVQALFKRTCWEVLEKFGTSAPKSEVERCRGESSGRPRSACSTTNARKRMGVAIITLQHEGGSVPNEHVDSMLEKASCCADITSPDVQYTESASGISPEARETPTSTNMPLRPQRGQTLSGRAFQTWGRDMIGPAVRVSELAEAQKIETDEHGREAYSRPANKRDLGHCCKVCRKPFNLLGAQLVTQVSGGPAQRFHEECWLKDPALARAAASREKTSAWRRPQVYTDAWRSAPTAAESSGRRHCSSPGVNRGPDILEGLLSYEDSCGNRRISRGFCCLELDEAVRQWSCRSAPEDECAICYQGTVDRHVLCFPCAVGHTFCVDCVLPWLRRCSLCPVCRRDLRGFLTRSSAQSTARRTDSATPGLLARDQRAASQRVSRSARSALNNRQNLTSK